MLDGQSECEGGEGGEEHGEGDCACEVVEGVHVSDSLCLV